MIPRVPQLTDAVRAFCQRVVADSAPVYLMIEPAAGAEVNDCFPVVERQIQTQGGELVLGWQIWEQPAVLIEAEFHGVWRSPDGELHDITPKPPIFDRILFVPDPSRVYDERQVDNIREALEDTPAVHEYIAAMAANFEFMNRGPRAHQHGELRLSPSDKAEYGQIQMRIMRAAAGVFAGNAPQESEVRALVQQRARAAAGNKSQLRNERKRERQRRRAGRR